jgi:hypothetical protein
MSKKPKIDLDYNAGKDKLTITIHRYSLKRKKTRDAIIQKLTASLEGKSAVIANTKKTKMKEPAKKDEVTTEE